MVHEAHTSVEAPSGHSVSNNKKKQSCFMLTSFLFLGDAALPRTIPRRHWPLWWLCAHGINNNKKKTFSWQVEPRAHPPIMEGTTPSSSYPGRHRIHGISAGAGCLKPHVFIGAVSQGSRRIPFSFLILHTSSTELLTIIWKIETPLEHDQLLTS